MAEKIPKGTAIINDIRVIINVFIMAGSIETLSELYVGENSDKER